MHLGPYLEQQTIVSPQLVLTSEVLQLPAVDLEQRILQELEENPALERAELFYCAWCGTPVAEGQRLCYHCTHQAREGNVNGSEWRPTVDSWIPEKITLKQHVWAQLRLLLPLSLHSLAEVVVGYLDEHGFIPLTIEELARRHSVSTEEVGRIVAALHELDPVGIGTRDAREALLTQIAYLSQKNENAELLLAGAILGEHWAMFKQGENAWSEIARAQAVTVEAIREAIRFIVRDLNPFPSQAWGGDVEGFVSAINAPLRPDLRLHIVPSHSGDRFEIELLEQHRFRLDFNELYVELAKGGMQGVDEDDVETARYYIEEARLFLHGLHQRGRTLTQVALALANYQRSFVLRGPRHLRPLTRARLATELGLHESTISRAVAHKTIQMPDQRVIPLADFFDNSLPAKHDLQSLIIQEDKAHPFCDRVLTSKLRALGHDITRRTVTKYRQALDIPSSRLRHLAARYKGMPQSYSERVKGAAP